MRMPSVCCRVKGLCSVDIVCFPRSRISCGLGSIAKDQVAYALIVALYAELLKSIIHDLE